MALANHTLATNTLLNPIEPGTTGLALLKPHIRALPVLTWREIHSSEVLRLCIPLSYL